MKEQEEKCVSVDRYKTFVLFHFQNLQNEMCRFTKLIENCSDAPSPIK